MFVTYYVSAARLVNWIGCTPSDGWREESWSARGDRDEALALFEGWHPQVRGLIAGTDHVFKWALFDRSSLEAWSRGRVTLLGDAAHPMLPFMGQGAAQSIEDGFALAHCLAADPDQPKRAIGTYAACRQERTAAMQAASREQGRDLQVSDASEVAARNAQMRESRDSPLARYDWAWGYDVAKAIANG
jgi:salicylate hydroxylase